MNTLSLWTNNPIIIEQRNKFETDYLNKEFAKSVYEKEWNRIKNDGSVFRDRAFANVYIDLFEGTYDDFDFDDEVSSVVLVNAKDVLALFVNNKGFIEGKEIIKTDKMSIINKKINIDEFLINEGETLLEKYGNVLKKIIEVTK